MPEPLNLQPEVDPNHSVTTEIISEIDDTFENKFKVVRKIYSPWNKEIHITCQNGHSGKRTLAKLKTPFQTAALRDSILENLEAVHSIIERYHAVERDLATPVRKLSLSGNVENVHIIADRNVFTYFNTEPLVIRLDNGEGLLYVKPYIIQDFDNVLHDISEALDSALG